jgi:hypothetical protein
MMELECQIPGNMPSVASVYSLHTSMSGVFENGGVQCTFSFGFCFTIQRGIFNRFSKLVGHLPKVPNMDCVFLKLNHECIRQ